jgi:hypothetical protein
MYILQLYHKIERFIDRIKVTSRGYDVMGLYTDRPCDVTKCSTARYVLELTCLRKKHFHVKISSGHPREFPNKPQNSVASGYLLLKVLFLFGTLGDERIPKDWP